MEQRSTLSPMEAGNLVALSFIGQALATFAAVDPEAKTTLLNAAETLLNALPDDGLMPDGSSANRAAMQALIAGIANRRY